MKKDKREEFYLGKNVPASSIYSIKTFNEMMIAAYKKRKGRYWDGLVESLIDTNRSIKNSLKVNLHV